MNMLSEHPVSRREQTKQGEDLEGTEANKEGGTRDYGSRTGDGGEL